MKKVSSRQYALKKTLDYVGVAFLLVVLLFFWQLYSGPISVPFLKPYIVQALNYENAENDVSLDEVNIELIRSLRPLKIIARNVKFRNNSESTLIEAPEVSLSFSIKALLHGMIAPSRIVVDQPKLYFFMKYGIDEQHKNEINKKKLEFYAEQFEEFVERFNSPDKIYAESYINDIVINSAEVEFHEVDLGRKWSFSDLNYRFSRNFTSMEIDFNTLINTKDRISSFGLNAKYRPSVNKVAFQTYVSEAYFSDLLENILPEDVNNNIYKFDIPVNATVEGIINVEEILKNKADIAQAMDSAVEKISFDVNGGNGVVVFSEDEEMNYPVNNFILSGEVSGGFDKISIDDANFDIDGKKIKISFETLGLKKYLLEKSPENFKMTLKTEIPSLEFDKLSHYWPRYVGEDAWQWCKDSLYGGYAKNAKFEFLFGYDKKKNSIAFENLSGTLDIEDSNIDYLGELPVVRNFYGAARFSNDSIYIKVDKGVADGVILSDGFVHLYDLGSEHNMIKIRLIGNSSIKDALSFINHEPLMLAKEIGIEPERVGGDVDVNVALNFELKNDIKPKDVKVEVTADLHNVKIKDVIDRRDLTAEKLTLVVNNNELKVFGKSKIDDVPAELMLNEIFADKTYKSRYSIYFRFDDEVKKKLGIDFSLLSNEYIKGFADINAVITVQNDDKRYVEISADLENTSIDYDFLGFVKHLGEPAEVYTKLNIKDGKVSDVPVFKLAKPDFSLSGNIKVDGKSGNVKLIDVSEIKGDKMSANAKIEFAKEKTKIAVSGYSYDLTTFFEKKDRRAKEEQAENKPDDDGDFENVDDMDIFIAVNSLWTNSEVPIKNFTGNAEIRKGIGVHELHMAGNYGNNQAIKMKLDYVPKAKGEYYLSIDSNNAGTTLKVLRFYDHMQGGTLKIEGRRDINKEFFGHAQIRNFSMHNTPVMAKIFTLASFTGMLDMLRGEGIAFSHFDAPFEYRNKTFYVKNAKCFGNVLGMSGEGSYNRSKEILNIEGLIAPAYSLNKFLGKIPLIGGLLSGKDGTVFAANYSVKGEISNPEIKVNPLSALPPNSVKELFGSVFGD